MHGDVRGGPGDVDAGAVTNRATATLNGVTSAAATATVSWVRSRDPQDNNDPPPENGNPPPDVPTLSVTGATVGEDGGSVTLAVSLAPTTVQTVQVTYATGDVTATAGEDYTAARGRLTFTPRLGSQAITVALSDDAVDESDETFTVELSLPANSQIGTGTATVTITDDDTRGLKVKPEALRVEEGDTSKYTVELATEPTGEVTVAMGTDLAGTDVTVDEASLTFTTGNWSTAQTVAVTAAEDDDGVADAAVELTHTASGGDYGSESATVTVTIAEDDTPAVVLSKSAVSVEEGAAGGSDVHGEAGDATDRDGDGGGDGDGGQRRSGGPDESDVHDRELEHGAGGEGDGGGGRGRGGGCGGGAAARGERRGLQRQDGVGDGEDHGGRHVLGWC